MSSLASTASIRCPDCARSILITRARKVRAHYTISGGSVECARSGAAVTIATVPLSDPPSPPRRPVTLPPPVLPSVPGRWHGPRRWEDADF